MPTSSIFTTVRVTDPERIEAFFNAMDEAANSPMYTEIEPTHSLVTDPTDINPDKLLAQCKVYAREKEKKAITSRNKAKINKLLKEQKNKEIHRASGWEVG